MEDDVKKENIGLRPKSMNKSRSENMFRQGNTGFLRNISSHIEILGWSVLILGSIVGAWNILESMSNEISIFAGVVIIIQTVIASLLILGFSRLLFLLEVLVEQGRER